MRSSLRLGVLALLLVLVSGCGSGDETVSVRFRTILTLLVDGKPVEFSNVYQVDITSFSKDNALGYGGSSKTYGEAMVVDLGERGRAYLMPGDRTRAPKKFSVSDNVYPHKVLWTFGVEKGIGALNAEDMGKIRSFHGRAEFNCRNYYGFCRRPALVAFKDEADPNSIFQLSYGSPPPGYGVSLESYFGSGVKFESLALEIVDLPVTKGVVETYLPWAIRGKYDCFERSPGGTNLPSRPERPFRWFLNCGSFYLSEIESDG